MLLTAIAVAACGGASKPDPATLDTYACELAGERIVVRFEQGEARLLMPGGERVTLYQVPSGSGVRFTNGTMDLFGKGTDLRLARDGGAPQTMQGCAPLAPPTK